MIEIRNDLSAEIFINLHKDNELKQFSVEILERAFAKNLIGLVLYKDDQPIGMGRIVGDDVTVFFIKDVAVDQKHQGKGYGKKIMEALIAYIKSKAEKGAYIGLMSTPGKEGFYKKFGFIERPNKEFGSGMVMFNE